MTHICLVAPHVWPIFAGDASLEFAGGAEVQQTFIARGLQAAGYRVTVLTDDYGQPDQTTMDGVRFIKIRNKGYSIPVVRYFHPRLTGLWSAMRRADADIYYQRCAGANTFVAAMFSKTHGRRFVYSACHDLDLDRPRTREIFRKRGGWRDLKLFRAGLKMADAIVAQHPWQIELCRRYYGREAEWIPSGYLPRPGFRCHPDGVILWVSILRKWKRPELFLSLAKSLPHLRFRMIGGATTDPGGRLFFSEVKQEADRLPNVEFLGFQPYRETDELFNDARLFVNTSDFEGFPNTFLQAWARGIPTVSFVDSGAKDPTGTIGVVAQDLTAMRDAIARLATDRGEWASHSARCREYFLARHAMPAVIERYRILFDRLSAAA